MEKLSVVILGLVLSSASLAGQGSGGGLDLQDGSLGGGGGTPAVMSSSIGGGGGSPPALMGSGLGGGGLGLCNGDAGLPSANLAIVSSGFPAQVLPTFFAAISMQYPSDADVCEATEN